MLAMYSGYTLPSHCLHFHCRIALSLVTNATTGAKSPQALQQCGQHADKRLCTGALQEVWLLERTDGGAAGRVLRHAGA